MHPPLLLAAPEPKPLARACVEAFSGEFDYLCETLRRLGAAHHEVQDLAHEAFLVLHRNWTTYDASRPLRPYLFAIAFRLVSSSRRRKAREVPQALLDTEDGAAGPDRFLLAKEALALLRAGLARVPLPRRAVLIMHDLDDVPILDVARTLSISRFTAYARLRKARKELAAAVRRLTREAAPA